jgi:hypothetical protein
MLNSRLVISPTSENVQLCAEDLLWSGLSFEVMDEEELARQQAEVEQKVHFHRGLWWVQVKYGFYRPSLPYVEVDHRQSWPHPLHALAGFSHLAGPNSPSNATYSAMVCEDVATYSIRRLATDRRTKLRKAMTNLTVRAVERLDDLLGDGYEVYVSWRRRVNWGKDKSERAAFEAWIRKAFRRNKRTVLGAYRNDKLVGFMLPYVVADVAVQAFIASHSDFLKFRPNEAMIHAFLSVARQTPGVRIADFGPISSKPSLDDFKLTFCSVKQFPAYTWIHPMIRIPFGKWLYRRYPWLVGS